MKQSSTFQEHSPESASAERTVHRPNSAIFLALISAVLFFAFLANVRVLGIAELHDSLQLSTHPLLAGENLHSSTLGTNGDRPDTDVSNYAQKNSTFSDIFLRNYWEHSTKHEPMYRPITVLSFAAQSWLFSNSPFAVSFVHLLLNAINGLLLFTVVLRLGFSLRMAAVTALLFVSMPMHIEVLATVSGRAELLATAFGLIAIDRFFALVRGWKLVGQLNPLSQPTPKRGVAVAAVAYLLALLCSESIVLLPLLILALDILCPTRTKFAQSQFDQPNQLLSGPSRLSDSTPQSAKSPTTTELLLYSVLLCALALYLLIRTAVIGFSLPAPHELLQGLSFTSRLALAAEHLLQYLQQSVLPLGFSADYHDYRFSEIARISHPKSLLAVLTLLGIASAAVVALSEKIRLPLLATLWFFLSILPASNIFFATNILHSDLLAYFPSIGICLFIAWIAVTLLHHAQFAGLVLLSAFLMLQTLSGSLYLTRWTDGMSLWSYVVQKNPGAAEAWQSFGAELLKKERFDEAINAYSHAKQLRHLHGIFDRHSTTTLAKINHRIGRREIAAKFYLEILQRNLKDLTTAISLGQLYLEQPKTHQEALKVFQFTARHFPENPHVHAHIAEALKRLGRYTEARREIDKALKLNKSWAYLHLINAEILEAQGEKELARVARQTAAGLNS